MAIHIMLPRVVAVEPLDDKKLIAIFDNGTAKTYDCWPLLDDIRFHPLRNENFFRCVHVEPRGYAIAWNDQIDLAESELWLQGDPA